jgi:hypothetical protein
MFPEPFLDEEAHRAKSSGSLRFCSLKTLHMAQNISVSQRRFARPGTKSNAHRN